MPDKRTYTFAVDQLAQMAEQAKKLSEQRKNVYFGVCPTGKNLGEYERPKINEISGVSVFWADIDIADNAHAANNLPPDVQSAIMLIPSDLPPSYIVHSGHGLHAYWLLREEWLLENDDERQQATDIIRKLQGTIRQAASARGWHVDSVSDLTRVLRAPNTWNLKIPNAPSLCQVIEHSDLRYNVSDFDILPEVVETTSSNNASREGGFDRRDTDGPADYMMQNCKFLQHWQLNYKTLPEPVWMAAGTNIIRGVDGEKFVIEAVKSWLGDKYNEKETFKKMQHWVTNCHPTTCDFIQNELQFKGCNQCGVTSPCAWSLGKNPQALAKIKTITMPSTDNVFTSEILGALAILEKNNPIEYAKFKDKCRGRVNLNDLSKTLKEYRKQNSGFEIIEGGQSGALQEGQKVGDVTTCQYVPDTPLNLAIPAGFIYGTDGVTEFKKSGDSNVYYNAAGAPVIISERIFNMDTKTEKVQLTFKYFNQWANVIRKRSEVFSARNIINLTDYGLNTSSESAKYLVKYLQALEAANPMTIPLKYAVSKIGWREHSLTDFIIPNTSDYRIDLEDEGEVTEAFSINGNFDDWKKTAIEIRKQPYARFILAASFAAPLLKIFINRNFMIYFWGTSGGGKTASMVFALSVWGSPNKLMKSFYGTQNGIEKALAFSNDFPMVINEKQVMNGKDKQDLFEQIVYMLEGGRGKLRASKNGLQKTSTWRSIGMASGEEPLSKENSIQGVKTRLLELNVYPVVNDDNFAKSLYGLSSDHHGHAGPMFIERLLKENENDYSEINNARVALVEIMKAQFPEHFSVHIDNVALVAIADYLSSMWIFGVDKKQAEQESFQLACTIMQELPTERQISDIERGWDFVQNWLAANSGRFEKSYGDIKITPCYGFKKDDYTCIYPEYITKALQDAGFSPDKLLREFANKGRIATESDGEKRRFKVLIRYNGRRTRVIKIYDNPQENLI
ncbi:MAG: hypothetical protein H6Q70_491 [Firmicutes bacterium]|nr:hypothetical protein [Bacillota bacterium]